MYSLFFIARNNLRKKKGATASLFLIMLVSSLILYVGITVLRNLDTALEQANETFHGADFVYIAPTKEEEKVSDIIFHQKEVAEYQKTQIWYPQGGVSYRENKAAEKEEYSFIFESIEAEKIIGVLPEALVSNSQEKSILLPYCMKTMGEYQAGDSIYLTLGANEYQFLISGFVEDPMFANPTNISIYKCYITEAYLQQIIAAEPAFEKSRFVKYQVRLKDGADLAAYDSKVYAQITKEVPEFSNSLNIGMNWEDLKGGGKMQSMIAMAIMLVFSGLLIIIALIIVRFSIRNFLQENMKNIGVLAACGYTTRQLKMASMLEMFGISFCSSITGVLIGVLCNGFIGSIQASMMGLSWQQTFDVRAAVIAILIVVGLVLGITGMVSRIYGRITVLSALRGGIHTHNFRKNYLPFEKSMFPVSFTMSCKTMLQEKLKNLAVLFIIMLLSFACCIGFYIYQNFSKDPTSLKIMTGIEQGTAWVNGENLEAAGEQVKTLAGIEQVLYYDNCSVKLTHGNQLVSVSCALWSEPEELINEVVVEGRLPRQNNEIVLSTVISKELAAEVGDVIYVEGKGERMDYIVCGIDQKINSMGRKTMMTIEGGRRLNGSGPVSTLYIYAQEGFTFDQLAQEIAKAYPDLELVDSEKLFENSMRSITGGMELICLIFVIVTIVVVTMVVMLLIKTKVMSERKNYGIQKALGFTSKQLMLQTILTNLPVDFMGAVFGVILARYLCNSLMALGFAFCGIKKCDMNLPLFWPVITVIGIVLLAFFAAALASAKIRKIEPVKLLQEDF